VNEDDATGQKNTTDTNQRNAWLRPYAMSAVEFAPDGKARVRAGGEWID
jgi:hypothetical protein